MISASLTIWVYCDGSTYDGCHALIENEANPITDDLSQEAYHDWIQEYGWLVVGDLSYCPVCRFELHD